LEELGLVTALGHRCKSEIPLSLDGVAYECSSELDRNGPKHGEADRGIRCNANPAADENAKVEAADADLARSGREDEEDLEDEDQLAIIH
jgi:hypothetical protein